MLPLNDDEDDDHHTLLTTWACFPVCCVSTREIFANNPQHSWSVSSCIARPQSQHTKDGWVFSVETLDQGTCDASLVSPLCAVFTQHCGVFLSVVWHLENGSISWQGNVALNVFFFPTFTLSSSRFQSLQLEGRTHTKMRQWAQQLFLAQSTLDASMQICAQVLWCSLHPVCTFLFTTAGSICLRLRPRVLCRLGLNSHPERNVDPIDKGLFGSLIRSQIVMPNLWCFASAFWLGSSVLSLPSSVPSGATAGFASQVRHFSIQSNKASKSFDDFFVWQRFLMFRVNAVLLFDQNPESEIGQRITFAAVSATRVRLGLGAVYGAAVGVDHWWVGPQ